MITTHSHQQAFKIISNHHVARVILNPSSGQKSLQAAIPFHPGDVICAFSAGSIEPMPTYLTIQISEGKHITLLPEFLQYTNHSCSPTVFFDTSKMELICIKEMQPGDEFTYFYPSTEWEMAQPFVCNCGSPDCLQLISGASQLPLPLVNKYRLSDFIRQKLNIQ